MAVEILHGSRVQHVWSLLVRAAASRKTYTYGELSEAIGMPRGAVAMRHYLGPIMRYCRDQQMPPLTVLVVNRTGLPGDGLTTVADVDKAREAVFAYNWLQAKPPPGSAR